jgi:hypothetical protein
MRYLVRTLAVSVVMASFASLVQAQDRPSKDESPPRTRPMPVPPKAPPPKAPPRLDRAFEIQPLPTLSANTYVARVRNKSESSQKARLVMTVRFSDGKTRTLESRVFQLRPGESTVASIDQSRVRIDDAAKVSVKVEPVRR